jgi:hypothetical protein
MKKGLPIAVPPVFQSSEGSYYYMLTALPSITSYRPFTAISNLLPPLPPDLMPTPPNRPSILHRFQTLKTLHMKNLYLPIACILLTLILPTLASGQGCVAVKNMSSHNLNFGDNVSHNGWQFSMNYRYFNSFRHFKGKEEQKERLKEKTEVINNDHSVILGIDYQANTNWSFALQLPFIYIDRSSLYEHDRQNRHHTQSKGIGDVRVMAYYSFSGGEATNFQVGLGLKLPTGNENYKDYFHTTDGPQLRPVDQSIQLGDGGTGIIIDFNGAREITTNTSLYLNALYMLSPKETNGTRTFRETLNPLLANESIMSVPDQYFLRAGVQYSVQHMLAFGAGVRVEGIPVEDLLGKSGGFRRPGYIISIEPSAGFMQGRHSVSVNFPIALVRNRTQSVTDKETERLTGTPRHGDAAFADWLLSMTYAYSLTK